MSNTQNVKLGVCSIVFGGVDLGYTKGGVEVEVATETHEVMVDQFGNVPINEYIMGRTVTVKCPLAETTLENMVNVMPGATLVGGGVQASGNFTFSTAVPAANDTVTINGVVFTFKAAPATDFEVKIGATIPATIKNLYTAVASSIHPDLIAAGYTYSASQLLVTYKTRGTAGNAFTLAKSGTNIAVSAATLTGGVGSDVARVEVETGIGQDLLSTCQQLVLHPIALAADNLKDDFIVPLANTAGALQFAYKLDEERIFNVEFKGYPDPVTKVLFKVGDPAAV
jgi:hypothetical protein